MNEKTPSSGRAGAVPDPVTQRPAAPGDGRLHPEEPVLARLTRWYAEQCDGEWEHFSGIDIETLDNPGWSVEIDTSGTATPLADFDWRTVAPDTNEDWLHYRVEDSVFGARGDPSKLDAMLRLFLDLVGRGRH